MAHQLILSLWDLGEPLLNYAALADRRAWMSISVELEKRFELLLAGADEELSMALTFWHDPGWDVPSHHPRLDVARMLKAKREIAREEPNSISRIAVGCMPSPDGQGFAFAPAIATISLATFDPITSSKRSIAMRRRSGLTIIHRKQRTAPTADDVRKLLSSLCDPARDLRRIANVEVEKRNLPDWGKSRRERELSLLQIGTLLPIPKAMFASGACLDALDHCLIEPMTQLKRVKRSGQCLSRDDVVDLWWQHALDANGLISRPPNVRM